MKRSILELAEQNGIKMLSEIITFGDRFIVKFRFDIGCEARLNTRLFASQESAEDFRSELVKHLRS